MNDLNFTFEESLWEQTLAQLNRGDVLSAVRFLTIMEQFAFALALSEIEAMRLSVDGKIDPSSIRMKMNDTLKAVIKGD